MELSHRGDLFDGIASECRKQIRKYLEVPDDFEIILQPGGATHQYTAIAKNLLGLKPQRKAMYLKTGLWSNLCYKEAQKFVDPNNLILVGDNESLGKKSIPHPSTWKIDPEASYFHLCWNETVDGLEFSNETFPWDLIPEHVALVLDVSSDIGTDYIKWDRVSVLYMGAQKNLGPAGLGIVIVKKSLLDYADKDVPALCDWKTY